VRAVSLEGALSTLTWPFALVVTGPVLYTDMTPNMMNDVRAQTNGRYKESYRDGELEKI
jgi:hypothetical protein